MILISIILLGLIGLIGAALLYFFSKKFETDEDPRLQQIIDVLPAANCGGCGYPGCAGFAGACIKADSLDGLLCPVGGIECMKKVAAVLGTEAPDIPPTIAVIKCNGSCLNRPRINKYEGVKTCTIASSLYGGETDCTFGCMGYGDCVEACAFDAIHINSETLLPEVDEKKCTSCGACVKACPKKIIELRAKGPRSRRIYVGCVNKDKGGTARRACKAACIACGKCQKACPFDAITIENNLAYIDYNKCRLCRKCAIECPTGAILETGFPTRKQVELPRPEIIFRKEPKTKGKEPKSPNKYRQVFIRTFSTGGVHPAQNKLTATSPIKSADIPAQVVIPLSQHIGAPALPVIQKGDKVKVGTLLATTDGFVSAPVYSSVSGNVNRIDTQRDASGYKRAAIVIDVVGDEWEETIDRTPKVVKECNLSADEILEKIKNAGIVGMGGATFPTHVKLTPPPGNKAEVLLINGAECEPYLTNDHRLMLERSEELLVGTTILMKALKAEKACIGIENNKPDAIIRLKALAKDNPTIEIVPLKTKYPQGSEKHLIDAIIHKRVKSGALPISVGAVVQNVSTAIAVYEAVQKNKPLFERVVTVTGKKVKNPANYLTRIGTPFQFLIDLAGGLPYDTRKIISGGPMMGKAVYDTSIPVTKGTSGIVIMSDEETKHRNVIECIRCGKCLQTCPMHLNPTLLMNLVEFNAFDRAEKEHIADCLECGSCTFSCPANRPLIEYIRMGKSTVLTNIRNRKS